jgi:UDP-N-acetylglucosamine 2-epimerase (non-hydrolysing)
MGIPVYHMEAGNRCYNNKSPEEVNRRIVDHCSDILMPYTRYSKENLVIEGITSSKIHIIGNPINEAIRYNWGEIEKSNALERLNLKPYSYFLVTFHRAENVDNSHRLATFFSSLLDIASIWKKEIIVSTHPRTRGKLRPLVDLDTDSIRLLDPFNFFDFVKLESLAECVITDSGTVQEECCILNVPSVVARDFTERPEIIDCGSSILSGIDRDNLCNAVSYMTEHKEWTPPEGYLDTNVSDRVIKILLGV